MKPFVSLRATKYYWISTTHDGDLICKLYLLSNDVCIAICRSKFKKNQAPYSIEIGYHPYRGFSIQSEIGFRTIEEAESKMKKLFAKGNPKIWIDNTPIMYKDTDFNKSYLTWYYTGTYRSWNEITKEAYEKSVELQDVIRPDEPLTKEQIKKIGEIILK